MDKILNPKFPIKLKIILSFSLILIFTNITIGYLSYRVSNTQLETSGKQIMQNSVQMTIEMIELKNKEVSSGVISLATAQEDVKEFILGPMGKNDTRPINKKFF